MSVRVAWSNVVGATSYRLESCATFGGTYTTVATITATNPGPNWDSALNVWFYDDVAGIYSTWYRLIAIDVLAEESAPSQPFQPGTLSASLLCTVADVKEYLSITHTEDDNLLARLVAGASAWMETQCGRHFIATTTNEIQYGEGGRTIVPYNYPLISVSSVVINDETVPAATLSTDTGYMVIDDAIKLRGYWIPADSVVSLTYVAGFDSIPEDVRQATIETAAMRFRERDRVGQQSKSMGGESVVFLPYSVPASVQATINSYRRIS